MTDDAAEEADCEESKLRFFFTGSDDDDDEDDEVVEEAGSLFTPGSFLIDMPAAEARL